MLRLQNTNEENPIVSFPQRQPEIVELSAGMRHFMDAVVKRMLEKDIQRYYPSNQPWDPVCPPKKPQPL